MDMRRRSLFLLEDYDWGEDAPMIEALRKWELYPLVRHAMETLKVDALYKSPVHGSGHINRVLFLSALIGMGEGLDETFMAQYLFAASYHDVGRYFDGFDLFHGERSALELRELTGCTGELLWEIQGAVAAHSQPDAKMEEIIDMFSPMDRAKTTKLACLLKDADNLDRVRLGDMRIEFIRSDTGKSLGDFAHRLFKADQEVKRNWG